MLYLLFTGLYLKVQDMCIPMELSMVGASSGITESGTFLSSSDKVT